MKYIIWGAGQLGKKALTILGKDKVIAFIDLDSELQKKEINGIKVIAPDMIECEQDAYIILISPDEYGEDIAKELDSKEIYNYLLFSERPYCLDMGEKTDSLKILHNLPSLEGNILLYGISWFNLFLYNYLKKQGKSVKIYGYGRNHEVLTRILRDEYVIVEGEECIKSADKILAPIGIRNIPKDRYIYIENYIEKIYPVFNSEISKFKNLNKGKSCFIVATGPSLRIEDLNKIYEKGDICISMNRIYNLFDRTSWRPDYYVVEDKKMIEDLSEDIAALDLQYKFVCSEPKTYWKQKMANTSIMYRMIMQSCLTDKIGFSLSPDRFMYNGYTVTYICLQLAVYMGFSEIYLIGVDFNYSEDIYAESNHFEGYQSHYKDIRLNPIHPDRMKRAYKKAREVAESKNIHIYNATRGGKLEVFDRVNLDDILKE